MSKKCHKCVKHLETVAEFPILSTGSVMHHTKGPKRMNLFVGNLTRDVTEADLRELFEPYGKLSSVSIVKDKFSGLSKGFAFVEMPVKAEAEAAIAGLYRKQLKGQSMDVTEARPRETRRPGSGGRGGGKRR